ncbi:hypothetical protein ACFQ08_12850 [Streptosporangium algeriense]|uniref:C-type cytochrome biogenesis protein CcsB n=1 Tax=Streptosporangium algeriense TaxID=1682748 RepID=A0ABW3DNJ9_9ACTN
MPVEVDVGLATLSDQLTLATVLLYIVAMIGYALDLGFGRVRNTAKARAAGEPALVTVGGTAEGADGGTAGGDAAGTLGRGP